MKKIDPRLWLVLSESNHSTVIPVLASIALPAQWRLLTKRDDNGAIFRFLAAVGLPFITISGETRPSPPLPPNLPLASGFHATASPLFALGSRVLSADTSFRVDNVIEYQIMTTPLMAWMAGTFVPQVTSVIRAGTTVAISPF